MAARPPQTLRLLGWPDYTLEEAHRRFEQQTGVAVVYEHFDQNEEAFERLRREPDAFDVVFADGLWPVEYLRAGLVQPLTLSELDSAAGLHPAFRSLCEQGAWAAPEGGTAAYPANFGTRGIVWDRTRVGEPVERWADLARPDLADRVWVNSQGSEVVAEVALGLGVPPDSVYSLDPAQLDAVGERMRELGARLGGVWMVWPDLAAAFAEHGALAAEVHTTHLAANLRSELGLDCAVTVPPEGTVAWVDGAMVTARTPLREAAVAFVDFLFSEQGVLLQWEESDGYAPASAAALAALREDGRWAEKLAAIAAEDPAAVLAAVLYRPPADVGAYLGAWAGLLKAAGARAPAAAWDGVRALEAGA